MRVFGVVGFALAFQSVVAVQLLLLPVSLFRRLFCCVSLLVFAQRVYAFCEMSCTFFFACATIDGARNSYLLHMWQVLAVCIDVDWKGVFLSAPSCCFSPVCNVLHAIYAARMSPISDTAAQLQHIESQLEALRALLVFALYFVFVVFLL